MQATSCMAGWSVSGSPVAGLCNLESQERQLQVSAKESEKAAAIAIVATAPGELGCRAHARSNEPVSWRATKSIPRSNWMTPCVRDAADAAVKTAQAEVNAAQAAIKAARAQLVSARSNVAAAEARIRANRGGH